METTQTDSAISSLQDFDLLQSSAPDPLRSTLRAKPGRPEPKTLTELVRARTNNGADLVNVLVAIVRGRYGATVSNRLRALQLLDSSPSSIISSCKQPPGATIEDRPPSEG